MFQNHAIIFPPIDLYYTNTSCLEDDDLKTYLKSKNLHLKEVYEMSGPYLFINYIGPRQFKISLEDPAINHSFTIHPYDTLNFWKVSDPGGSGPLRKALKLTQNSKEEIADFTAGFLKDCIYIWRINGRISAYERNPYLFHILEDGLRREPLQDFKLNFGNPVEVSREKYKKVYMDPMYPKVKRQKSKAKKEMEFLKRLCGKDEDEKSLIEFAVKSGAEKVVLKRPEHAEIYFEKDLKGQIKGKNIRYDLY